MKLLYFRDIRQVEVKNTIGETEIIDFKDLTLIDRLFVSAYLTKKDTGTKKTLAEIIFAYGDEYDSFTRGNFVDYDSMISSALDKWSNILHWIDTNHNKRLSSKGTLVTDIKCIPIRTEDIFALKNGRTGMALSPIAWKAYALAAAKSKRNYIPYLRMLNIYNWLDASVNIKDMDLKKYMHYRKNASQTRNTIRKWIDAVGLKGEFVGKYKEVFEIGEGVKEGDSVDD